MSKITLHGNPCNTSGTLPSKGSKAADFVLVKNDLSTLSLEDLKGKKVILNIYPSVDTGICATSTRKFNEKAASLKDSTVVCISRDLPFAFKRFCAAEGIDNVVTASDFRDGSFGKSYGLDIIDGPMQGLHSRAVVVLDTEGKVIYTQQVSEIVDEPDYDAALAALKA